MPPSSMPRVWFHKYKKLFSLSSCPICFTHGLPVGLWQRSVGFWQRSVGAHCITLKRVKTCGSKTFREVIKFILWVIMSKGPQTQTCMHCAKWKCRNQVQKFGILIQKLERKSLSVSLTSLLELIHLVALFGLLIPCFQSKRFIVLRRRTCLCQFMVSLPLFLHACGMYLITNWSIRGTDASISQTGIWQSPQDFTVSFLDYYILHIPG